MLPKILKYMILFSYRLLELVGRIAIFCSHVQVFQQIAIFLRKVALFGGECVVVVKLGFVLVTEKVVGEEFCLRQTG